MKRQRLVFSLMIFGALCLGLTSYASAALMDLPPYTSTFSGNVRGYWFEAPVDFDIIGLRVPNEAGGTVQNIEVIRFNSGPPPFWSTTTNDFVSLGRWIGVEADTVISTNISISAGDNIAILGAHGTTTMSNSYGAAPFESSIDGNAVTLTRCGMQYNLYDTPAQDIWQEAGGSISRVEMYYTVTGPVTVSIGDSSVVEGDDGFTSQLSFPVTLSEAWPGNVTVDWITSDGTATAGLDYTAGDATVSVPAGSLVENIVVDVLGDTTDEPDETLLVTLSNSSVGSTIVDDVGSGLIIDDDPLPEASAGDRESCEGMVAVAAVSLDRLSSFEIGVDYETIPGTASAGIDYIATSGRLLIPAGEMAGYILVQLIDDAVAEGDKHFEIALSNADNAVLLTSSVTVTICDDESGSCIFADGFETNDPSRWSKVEQ